MAEQKHTIWVISGFSGSGKDTAASCIDAINVKFSHFGKRFVENLFNLPEGYMDDRVLRLNRAPHCGGKSYLDVLIALWEVQGELLSTGYFPEQSRPLIEQGLVTRDVVITDCRSYRELYIIRDFAAQGHPVYPIWIEGGFCLKSDGLSRGIIVVLAESLNMDIISMPAHNDNPDRSVFKAEVAKVLAEIKPSILKPG